MLALWARGLKLEAIGSEVGLGASSVRRRLLSLGVPYGASGKREGYIANGKRSPVERNLWPFVVAWARAGHTPQAIADGLGITGPAREILIGEAQ